MSLKYFYENLEGSELQFRRIQHITLQTSLSNKTRGGSYIKTPAIIGNKKGCVNIKNVNDNMCIKWCLLTQKYYDQITHNKKLETSTYKKYFDEIVQPKDITYPIDIQTDIKKFEKLNNIKINVFEYNGSYTGDYDRNNIVTLYNTHDKNEM